MKYQKTILTDADGVLLDWEWAFNVWMQEHGFELTDGYQYEYDMSLRYGISKEQVRKLIRTFNESAAIGFLPVLRDAMYWVKRLHEQHGYTFHAITSLSLNENAGKLREMNLEKMFGKTAFSKVLCLDTGADKTEALKPYTDSGCWWIEDKPENAAVGLVLGLKPLLMEHGHNMNYEVDYPIVKNWEDIYRLVTKV